MNEINLKNIIQKFHDTIKFLFKTKLSQISYFEIMHYRYKERLSLTNYNYYKVNLFQL